MKRLAVLALVAACSGGGADKVASGLSKADYLRQAEAICATANKDQDALKTPTSVDALAPYVEKVVGIADRATTQINALEAPSADRQELEEKVLTPLKDQLEVAHEYADKVKQAAAKKDNLALVGLLSDPPTETKADLRWMKRYGFEECIEAADTSG